MSITPPTLTLPVELSAAVRQELQSLVAQFGSSDAIDVPFEQSNFEARSGLVWTIDRNNVSEYYYVPHTPTRITMTVTLLRTTLSGTMNNTLRVKIPGGRLAARTVATAGTGSDNGAGIALRVVSTKGDPWLIVFRSDLANWSASSANLTVAFQIMLELLPVPS
jgi:hypothetical protein